MTPRFSAASLFRNALSEHKNWPAQFRSVEPKSKYQAVIIGGGGHGLSAAYHLAREFGITNVAVIEKGWIGGGNTGRNTAMVRSNYLQQDSVKLYDASIKMWESMSQELNYNVMFSQRGLLHLAHSVSDMQEIGRRAHAINMFGADAELLSPGQIREWLPNINLNCRFPVMGALLQRRGAIARHDAMAWGYARCATDLGVDIVQNCEVNGFDIDNGRVKAVHTTRGRIETDTVGLAVSGHSTQLADMAGFRLPIETVPLQALVTEPLKSVLKCGVISASIHAYVSQSDKGELVIGGGTDPYVAYANQGGFDEIETMMTAIKELFPNYSRLRIMRQWAGMVDLTPDRSPIISKTPIKKLYIDGGWGTGGFKTSPIGGLLMAEMIAKDTVPDLAAPFALSRFNSGTLVDEGAASSVAH
ncbi:MAG: sarcosine oxidase subunit beta family protein [Gammaproteobacteria bacterium]|nr:sarcosine oxidase subunit beta family protein [Gammaproteobacteria bacterium]